MGAGEPVTVRNSEVEVAEAPQRMGEGGGRGRRHDHGVSIATDKRRHQLVVAGDFGRGRCGRAGQMAAHDEFGKRRDLRLVAAEVVWEDGMSS